jgi:glycosyltransferase involved in cell wall biosynthesis
MVALRGSTPPSLGVSAGPRAILYGIVKRNYKGSDVFQQMAARGVPGWQFALVGPGAPERAPGLQAMPGFMPAEELVANIEASAATVLPYRMASQSGAVALSQVLGSVPVTTAVGGIPEQVVDGETGILLDPAASVDAWIGALQRLTDPIVRHKISVQATAAAWEAHAGFVEGLSRVVFT